MSPDLQETTNKILDLQKSKTSQAQLRIRELQTLCEKNVNDIVADIEREINIQDLYNNLSELRDMSNAFNLEFYLPFENMYYDNDEKTWNDMIFDCIDDVDRQKYQMLFDILYSLENKSQRWHHSLAQNC